MSAVSVTDLGKTYEGGVSGLRDFTLSIEPGEVVGLLGPNGAGKTTTVRLLNGTLEPTTGTALVFGHPASDIKTKQRTATLAEMARMYEHMSAAQNLEFFAAMYGLDPAASKSRIYELLERMGLAGRENDKIGSFSTGMKKRVQLARVLLHDPDLIFLDEPTSGLDPDAARQVTELIRNLAQDEGTTVILCTHNLPLAEKVCDVFGFLSEGSLVAHGSQEELTSAIREELTVEVATNEGIERISIKHESEINSVLRQFMDAGRSIREVRIDEPDLESLYFSYIGRSENELG